MKEEYRKKEQDGLNDHRISTILKDNEEILKSIKNALKGKNAFEAKCILTKIFDDVEKEAILN